MHESIIYYYYPYPCLLFTQMAIINNNTNGGHIMTGTFVSISSSVWPVVILFSVKQFNSDH